MSELSKRQLYRKEYYEKNKEKASETSKARYLKRKDELLEYQREYRKKNRELVSLKTGTNVRIDLLEAISLLGGKCNKCQGIFDPCVYDFHHTNPKEKDFTIGENMLVGKDRFFAEISKCILLCANCHRTEHNNNE